MIESLHDILNPDIKAADIPAETKYPAVNHLLSDPYPQETGGYQVDPVLDAMGKFASQPDKEATMAPYQFDWDATRTQKFVNAENTYKLIGADPRMGEQLNEQRFADLQTGWDENKRMAGGFFSGLGHGFYDAAANFKNIGSWFSDPSLQSSFKQDQLEEINRKQQEFDDNYHIFQGDNPTIYSNIAKGVQGSGHFIGALAEIAASAIAIESIVAATGGASAPLEGILGAELEALSAPEIVANSAKTVNRIMNPSFLQRTWGNVGQYASNAGKIIPGIGNTAGYVVGDLLQANGASAISTISRGFGAFAHDLNSINIATGFASGNAAATYQQMVNDQVAQYKRDNNKEPGYADMQTFTDRAMKASKVDGAINAWGMLMFEKAAMGNLLNSRTTLQEVVNSKGLYKNVGVKPSWVQGAETEPVYMRQQAKWYDLKANLTNNYYEGARNIGKKGIEFGVLGNVMGAVDTGVKSYFEALYDNKDVTVTNAIRKGIDSQFTKEGKDTFISGFLQGAITLGIAGAAFARIKDYVTEQVKEYKGGEEFVKAKSDREAEGIQFASEVNSAWKNPLNPVKATIRDMVLQNSFAEAKKGALAVDNLEDFHSIKDDADRQFITKMIKSNLADMWTDRLSQAGRALGQDELCKLIGVSSTPENYQAIQESIAELPNRVKEIKRIRKEVDKQLGNPFDPYARDQAGQRLYPDGSEEFTIQKNNQAIHEANKDYLAMVHDIAERAVVRQSEILNGKGTSTGILDMPFTKNLDFTAINTAMSPDLLQRQIFNADEILKIDPKDVGANKNKEVITAYKEVLDSYLQERVGILKRGAYDNRYADLQKIRGKYNDDLSKSLYNYLENSVKLRNINGKVIETRKPPTLSEVREGMDKMMDYYDLGIEHDRALDTLNTLLDPGIIKKFQMSFFKEGTRRMMQDKQEIKDLRKERDKLKALIDKLNTPGEGELSNKEQVIKDSQSRIDEINADLKKRGIVDVEPEVVIPTDTTTESQPTPQPVGDTADIRTNIKEWLMDVKESVQADIDEEPYTPVKLSVDAAEYLDDDGDLYKALKALKLQLEGVYGKGDIKGAESIIDKFLAEHFDRDLEPLDYSHLPDKPKVIKVDDFYTFTGTTNTYPSIAEANKALQDKYPIYDVQGTKFQKGQYLYDDSGKQYILKDRDIVIPTKGKSPKPVQVTDEQLLKYHTTKPPEKSGKPVIPDDKYRLSDVNEISEVHSPGRTDAEMVANQIIIDGILSVISKDQLSENLSIQISANPPRADVTYDNPLTAGNPYITINREPNTIAIYKNGKDTPMSYITHPNKYLFKNPFTGEPALVPEKEWFEYVYNLNGKPLDEVYNQWLDSYNKSQQLAEVIDKIIKDEGGQVTGYKLDKYVKLSTNHGGYDFIPRTESDRWPTISDTIATGKELFVVVDQKRGDVVYGAKPKDMPLPAEPNFMGNYIAGFRMPTGDVRWTQMVAPSMTEVGPEELTSFIADYITKASVDIRQLASEGDIEGAKNMANLATNKLKTLFITQRPKLDSAEPGEQVVSFNLNMGKSGNVNVGYKVSVRTEQGWIDDKRSLHITINSGVGIDKPATGEEFIRSLETKTNNYFKKNNLKPVEIRMDNIRKGFNRDESGKIAHDVVMQSKITTSTDIVKNIKLYYTVDKSGLYQDIVPQNVPRETLPIITDAQRSILDIKKQYTGGALYFPINASGSEVAESLRAGGIAAEDVYNIKDEISGKLRNWFDRGYQSMTGKTFDEINVSKQETLPEEHDTTDEDDRLYELAKGYTPDITTDIQLADEHGDDLDSLLGELNSAKKLVPYYTVNDVISVEQLNDEIAKTLPSFISVGQLSLDDLMKNLSNNGITAGEFVIYLNKLTGIRRGVIKTSGDLPYKYHEVGHSIFRMLLSGEQQRALLDEAHKLNPVTNTELKNFRKLYGEQATADDFQEEWVMDKFEDWKKDHKTSVGQGMKSWFQRLWDWLKEITKRFTGSKIEALFYKYNRGGFKYAKLQDNGYTTTTANSSALKLIEIGDQEYTSPDGTKVTLKKTLDQNTGQRLSSTIAALYNMEALISDHNKQELLNSILDNYRNTLNPAQDRYREQYKDLFKADKVNAVQWAKTLNERYNLFKNSDSRKSLIEAVDEHLKLMGYKQDLEDDKVIKLEQQVGTKNYDTQADEVGGYDSLTSAIKEYIGSTVVPYTDEFGNSEFINGKPMYQALDGAKVYNGLMQLLKNTPYIHDRIDKLINARYSGDTGDVIRKLMSDTGFVYREHGDWEITKNKQLFVQFLNGFNQASIGHIFVEAGTIGGLVGSTTRAYEANRQTGDINQVAVWAEAWDSMYLQGYQGTTAKKTYAKEHTSSLKELRDELLDKSSAYTDDTEFTDKAQQLSDDIKEQLGLSIHPKAIEYSIASTKTEPSEYMQTLLATWKADPIDPADLYEIRDLLLDGKNPFTEAENRIRHIAQTVGVFDDTVDSTTYTNAEGKNIYSFQKYNYILEKGLKLNDSRELELLRTDVNTSECHFLEDENWLNCDKKIAIADGLALRYHDTKGEEIETPQWMETNQTNGTSVKHFNTRELNYYQFALAQRGREVNGVWETDVIPAIISDKSRFYMFNTPSIDSVYTKDGKPKLTEIALSKLYNIVAEELSRIQRVQREIGELPVSEYKVDWHNGDLDGLKFNRAKQMLGDLINPDGTLKEEGLPKEYPVRHHIENYFNSSIDKYIEDLKEQGLINPDGTNRLLPDYLWKGLGGKKGEGLNLDKADFRYNLSQVYINNFINADGFTHLLSPDGINTKRLSFWNADGDSAAKPNITAPELGIHKPFTDIHVAIIKEPKDETGFDHADSQGWVTEEGMRYMHWGWGTLTAKRAAILDKIATGAYLDKKEVFGKGGIVSSKNMLNPLKPVFYDGYTGLKLSATMLSKNQVMVKGPNGIYIPDIRRIDLYNIWKTMRDHEQATGQPCLVIPESASKLQTKNIAESADRLNTSHFTKLDANYLRKQLENPSNSLEMTKPTQPVWQLPAEQNDSTEVMGSTVAAIKQQYGQAIADRLQQNWNNALNGVFSIAGDNPLELDSKETLDKITPIMGRFYDQMRETLQATGANEQTLGFLETRNGEPVYPALDFPATLDKCTQQVLNYFGKVMNEQVPGLTCTKVSPYGYNIIREIHEVDSNGTPIPGKWRVINDKEYRKDPQRYRDAKTYTDEKNRTHTGLKRGDYIIDHLRVNVPEYIDGNPTGINYSEYIVPIHHIEDGGTIDSPLAMGYRNDIPYAAGNNGNVWKRVDTLPSELGSIQINPSAQSKAGGKDHDLDKDYLQIYSTYSDGEKLIKYGTAETDHDKFEEYLMYQASKNKQVQSAIKSVEETDKGFVAAVVGDNRQILIQALADLKLPSTVEEFVEKGGDKLNVGVLNNKELDTKIALAGNSHVAGDINLTSTSTDLLGNLVKPGAPKSLYDIFNKKLEDETLTEEQKNNINDLLSTLRPSDININEMRGQSDTASSVWSGKNSVGVAANGVPVLSFALQHKLKVNGEYITFNGHKYNSLGSTLTTDGTRKFDAMMTYINTMTDNAKLDGLAAKLGLSREALSDAMTMNATGMNIDDSILYMLQPAVRKYYQDIAYLGGTLKSFEEAKLSKSRLLQEAIERYTDKSKELTREDLENGIVNKDSSIQLSALLDIQKASIIGSGLFDLSRVLGLSGGLQASWEEVDQIQESIDRLYDPKSVINLIDIHDPILDKYLQMFQQMNKLSPLLFMERSDGFRRFKQITDSNFRLLRGAETQIATKQRKQDIISYLSIAAMTNELMNRGTVDTLNSLDNSLIYNSLNGHTIHDIVKELKQLKSKKANYFINEFVRLVEKPGVSLLNTNMWAKLSDARQIQLRDSLFQLINDLATRDKGITLFNYLLVKDGGQFKSGSFIKYVAPAVFKDLLDATARVKKVLALKHYDDKEAQDLFGTDWKTVSDKWLKNYSLHVDNKRFLKYIRPDLQSGNYPVYRTGNEIHIDMFRGIDSSKGWTTEHNALLDASIDNIKSVGFDIVEVPTGRKDRKGKPMTARHMALPYAIRSGEQVYVLQDKDIVPGQDTATGTTAIYKPTDTTGARNTYRAAGANFGRLPYTSDLKVPTTEKTVEKLPYSPLSKVKPTEQVIKLQEQPLEPNSNQEAIKELVQKHGILIYNEEGRNVAYRDNKPYSIPQSITNPKELLSYLNNQEIGDTGFDEDEGYDEDALMEMARKGDISGQSVVPSQQMNQVTLFPEHTPVKNHAMSYKMPAKDNLTGKDTSTVELSEQGIRTGSTRSYPLGKVGDTITFENRPQRYRITGVEQLTADKVSDPTWIQKWSQKEQWTPEYFKQVLGGSTVHVGSWQTTFERIGQQQMTPEQWKSEIDALSKGKSDVEQFKTDARNTYTEGKKLGMSDQAILEAIKCL